MQSTKTNEKSLAPIALCPRSISPLECDCGGESVLRGLILDMQKCTSAVLKLQGHAKHVGP
jgi:hypothetical protein